MARATAAEIHRLLSLAREGKTSSATARICSPAPKPKNNCSVRVLSICCRNMATVPNGSGARDLGTLYGGQFKHHRAALHGLDDQQVYSAKPFRR